MTTATVNRGGIESRTLPDNGIVDHQAPGAIVVSDVEKLAAYAEVWQDLADNACEPNAFFEPWMIIPAARHLMQEKDVHFLFVFDRGKKNDQPVLCGFFPFERHRRFKGLPISLLTTWEYGPSFLLMPLIRKGYEERCLDRLFDWLAEDDRSASIVRFSYCTGDGPFYRALVDQFRKRGTLTFIDEAHTRAFFKKDRDGAEAYILRALSPNKRRDLKRKRRRLSELGNVTIERSTPDDDPEPWIAEFLDLEASGWKGREGTALACKDPEKRFFEESARAGWRQGRLWMTRLRLDERTIAVRCNFRSPPGSFFFKPAYDERFSRYSPGVLVELETIGEVFADPDLEWMDSCTSPDNSLLNQMWLDRRLIQAVVMATGRGWGKFAVSILPLMRWLNRKLGRYRPPAVRDH